jgi:hypothetical protein
MGPTTSLISSLLIPLTYFFPSSTGSRAPTKIHGHQGRRDEAEKESSRASSSTTPSTSPEPATQRLAVAEKATTSKELRVGGAGFTGDELDAMELRGRAGAVEDRRRRSFDEGGAARWARERRRPRGAVAGGPAGSG